MTMTMAATEKREGEGEGRGGAPSFVAVVGAEGAGARALVRSSKWLGDGESEGDLQRVWRFQTKYYSAETEVRVFDGPGGLEGLDASAAEVAPEAPQALVCVVNIDREESFDELRAALEATVLKDANADWFDRVEVRLLVANGAGTSKSLGLVEAGSEAETGEGAGAGAGGEEGTHWLCRCHEWCRDNLFEYVECCTEDEGEDARLRLFEDPQGVSRVIEALHCHRWPQSDMAPPPAAHAHAHPHAEAGAEGEAEVEDEESAREREEAEVEGFEMLLAKLAGARGAAEGLSDEQRRENAEKMLFSIMGQLGLEDEEAFEEEPEA